MLENDDIEIAYDDFAYPSMTVPDTHPDSIAAIARFHGLESASPQKCKVLELGCGNGSNLNWIASVLPDGEFIGIDLSKNHIIRARETVSNLGINNASFHQRDLLELDDKSFGKFDYIVAHGLFSWVPETVAEKILELYGKLLNQNGVGYISYNTLPGCHLRTVLRDSLLFHTRKTTDPFKKVEDARAFARFISESSYDSSPFPEVLKFEYEKMVYREDSNVYHDDLSPFNNPLYFSDFIGRAEKHGLQFLSEARSLACFPRDFPSDVLEVINKYSDNVIEKEQYVDMIEGTRFRKTLICSNDVVLDHEFRPESVKRFFISTALRPDSAELKTEKGKTQKFVTDTGSTFETDHLLTIRFLSCFRTNKSHQIPFEELIDIARADLDQNGFTDDTTDEEVGNTISVLIQLYLKDLISFHVCGSPSVNYIPEKPRVSELARMQAKKGERIPTFQGINLILSDDFTKELFDLLNGEHTRDEIIEELVSRLMHEKDGDKSNEEFTKYISERLDEALTRMAWVGLLF